jgi:hypothetical protein
MERTYPAGGKIEGHMWTAPCLDILGLLQINNSVRFLLFAQRGGGAHSKAVEGQSF